MAKTVLEKLADAISAAVKLRGSAVIGNQEGQFSKEHADSLTASIELVQGVSGNENAEQQQLEKALSDIEAAIKFFKGSVVKPAPTQPEVAQSVSLKGVVLKGTDSEKKGTHTIFAYGGAVTFKDGKVDVAADLADKLISDGYAEEVKPEAGE